MTTSGKRWRDMVLGLVFTAIILWGGWHFLTWAATTILSLEQEVAKAAVVACGAVTIAVLTTAWSQRANKLRDIREAHRPSKVQAYNLFMDFVVDLLKGIKTDTPVVSPQGELSPKHVELWFAFKRDLIVWAGPKVITEYLAFESLSKEDPADALRRVDALLRAMREDLRNSNRGLQSGDLIRLFLKPEDRGKF